MRLLKVQCLAAIIDACPTNSSAVTAPAAPEAAPPRAPEAVAGTLMVEPTESEDKAELNQFCGSVRMEGY